MFPVTHVFPQISMTYINKVKIEVHIPELERTKTDLRTEFINTFQLQFQFQMSSDC